MTASLVRFPASAVTGTTAAPRLRRWVSETSFGLRTRGANFMHQARHDSDSYQRVEVITGLRRRRDWSDAKKARILAESADPEVNISAVARRNGVSRGLLNVWRRKTPPKSYSNVISNSSFVAE